MTRVTSDVEVLNDLFSSGVVAIIGDLVLMVAILVMMFAMSWQLALVTLLLLPGIAAISFFFRRPMPGRSPRDPAVGRAAERVPAGARHGPVRGPAVPA